MVFEEGFAPINSDKSAVDQLVSGEKLIELLLRKIEEKDNKVRLTSHFLFTEMASYKKTVLFYIFFKSFFCPIFFRFKQKGKLFLEKQE